jgi:hypothetical protein
MANDTLSKLNFIHKPLWKLTRDVGNGLLSQMYRFVFAISPDDGGNKHLLNVSKRLPDHTTQQPRRQPSSIRRSFVFRLVTRLSQNYQRRLQGFVCVSQTAGKLMLM